MGSDKKIPVLKRNDFLSFIVMLGAAFALSYAPVLHWPLSWMQTFFHEISHGIMAILTGGFIVKIELNLNGSGLCTSANGIRFFTSFAGYFGAIIWGALIYIMADNASPKSADRIAMVILALIGMTALLWARDFVTLGILGMIAVPFLIILKTKELLAEQVFMRFAGLYILLDAIKSPLYLFRSETGGDAATLQKLTMLPQFVWVSIWFFCGVLTLIFLFIRHLKVEKKQDIKTTTHKEKPALSVQARTESLLKKIKNMKE